MSDQFLATQLVGAVVAAFAAPTALTPEKGER